MIETLTQHNFQQSEHKVGFDSTESRFHEDASNMPSTVLLAEHGSKRMPPAVAARSERRDQGGGGAESPLSMTASLSPRSSAAPSPAPGSEAGFSRHLRSPGARSVRRSAPGTSPSSRKPPSLRSPSLRVEIDRSKGVGRVGSTFFGSGLGLRKQLPKIKSPGSAKQVIARIVASLREDGGEA